MKDGCALNNEQRKDWMSVLAKADVGSLENLWPEESRSGAYKALRAPEIGLVMVRGRMGGHGAPFNVGEATVTRCSVENASGCTGHAYVLGRSHRHARIAAEIDADLQDETLHGGIMARVIEPLRQAHEAAALAEQRKAAATKVDFFTMVRGED